MKQRNSNGQRTVLLAGWLFADLFLVIAMIFLSSTSLASSPLLPLSSSTSTPLSSQPELSTQLPNSTSTPSVGIDLTPLTFSVRVDPESFLANSPISFDRFKQQVDSHLLGYSDRKAGLIITLGYHISIGKGRQLAIIANNLLVNNYPSIFNNTVNKAYWWDIDETHPAGMISFEIYFFLK